eukprot:7194795-Karenia_brevis.AAC.1
MAAGMTLTLINCYAPQAERDEAEKEQVYEQLQQQYDQCKGPGPTLIMGDMNARIQRSTTKEEGK